MIASYTLDEPVLKNNDDYIIWQFTATGSAKGVRGDVDISRFRGNHMLNEILYK
jgi:lysozyme